MTQQNWAKVLSYLYNEQETISFLAGGDISETDDVVSSTGLEPQVIHEELEYLGELELVNRELHSTAPGPATKETGNYDEIVQYSLSKKGFDVAHERELDSNRRRTNMSLVFLTAFLAIGSILQGYAAYLSMDSVGDLILLSIILIIVVVFVLQVFLFIIDESLKTVLEEICRFYVGKFKGVVSYLSP